MKKSDFNFSLPAELIAQAPLPERSASRLLRVPPLPADFTDHRVSDLGQFLRAGDLLVFNDTRVLPARLFGAKHSGGRVEILVERILDDRQFVAQVSASKSPRPDSSIHLDDGTALTMLARQGEFYLLRLDAEETVRHMLARIGQLPLPPYIDRVADTVDEERYQTVYARHPGAVAAPTAGLHFDDALLQSLQAQGVEFGHVTLHVGAGTFQPMRGQLLTDHVMHSEWLRVPAQLCADIARARAAGGRIVAVGTTVVRALETAWSGNAVQPFEGETRIFIHPGVRIRSVDLLLTNFHLPESTLLMLVSAFAGTERILAAYQHAIAAGYRFFSYGDAMLLYPEPSP